MHRLARLSDRLFPPAPAPIRGALVAFQYQAVRRQIPSLHLAALFNLAIVMGVLWDNGAPLASYAWMPLVGLLNVHRLLLWRGRSRDGAVPADAARTLRNSSRAALASVAGISLYSAWSYWLGLFPYPLLIPVSVTFGSFSIAHCLASLRPAAAGCIVIGIVPTSLVMMARGDFLSLCIGASAISVSLLQLRLLAEHERHILATLLLQREVEQLANRDGLTGLLNRRAFIAAYERAVTDPGAPPRALLVLDIDHFKRVNDCHGHDVGDRVLLMFSGLLRAACGDGDAAGRFGGEEFVMLVAAGDSRAFAAGLGQRIARHDFRHAECPVERVTVSIGVHPVDREAAGFDAAFARADAALYAAKAAGRNRVCASPELRALTDPLN
ncbi:MAG: diguanylate cyclase [Sphingomonadaceae bacterium]|nr:diguanylate cyclase [Sphingomonadaceae bacterium]